MRLTHVRVTNFKSVEDSTTFSVGDVTCLVGKNEAGKTALLQALYQLQPDGERSKFDVQSSYPRRFLAEYQERHPDNKAQVLETTWEIDDKEAAHLKELLGNSGLTGRTVVVRHSYNDEQTRWSTPVNEGEVSQHLINNSSLHSEERAVLENAKSVSAIIKAIEGLGTAATERHKTLQALITSNFKRGSGSLAFIDHLELPTFFYFSSYDRMSGQVSLEDFLKRKAANELKNSDRVFLAFLGLAGTNLEEMAKLNKFEPMIALLESVSSRISREVFAYWSQNKNLKVQFRLDAGNAGDPAPFNTGHVLRTRIENTIHEATVSFDDRSTGFVWFFSFLVLFSQLKKLHGNNIILLLDEPGTSLHAKAQEDLLRYFKEKLIPFHQVIYTTHSPFMVPADNLLCARTVEDVIKRDQNGNVVEVLGTKVSEDVLSVDRETLFPLQGALGYEITQTLFIGKNSLLVEGPSDLLYMKVFSSELAKLKRTKLDQRWTITPAGGVDKISAFMSLLYGNKLNVAVFTDVAQGQKKKVDDLRKSRLLAEGRVLTASGYTRTEEADIEDLIGRDGYIELVRICYSLDTVPMPANVSMRVVKDVEEAFRILPSPVPEFDHFAPASYLVENPQIISGLPGAVEALGRFEKLFIDLNSMLNS